MALDFLAGCVGGCTGVLVGHPLDTVKVMLQVQKKHSGLFSCVRDVVYRDSLRGLYRGVTSPIYGVAFVNAIVFGVYGNVQRRFGEPESLSSHAIAGASAGLFQSFVCSPVELAKTRMQLSVGGNALSCLADIVRREGPKGFYRGLSMTMLRDVPAFTSYFVSYEALLKTSDGTKPGPISILTAGGLAGVISWIVTFPIDAVKSRIQADGMSGRPIYSGALDCLRKSIRADGPQFLTRGLGAVLLRAFPTNAACFGGVHLCMQLANSSPTLDKKTYAEKKDVREKEQIKKTSIF